MQCLLRCLSSKEDPPDVRLCSNPSNIPNTTWFYNHVMKKVDFLFYIHRSKWIFCNQQLYVYNLPVAFSSLSFFWLSVIPSCCISCFRASSSKASDWKLSLINSWSGGLDEGKSSASSLCDDSVGKSGNIAQYKLTYTGWRTSQLVCGCGHRNVQLTINITQHLSWHTQEQGLGILKLRLF